MRSPNGTLCGTSSPHSSYAGGYWDITLATQLNQLPLAGSEEEEMLSVARDMANRAAEAGQGLLWGNDVR